MRETAELLQSLRDISQSRAQWKAKVEGLGKGRRPELIKAQRREATKELVKTLADPEEFVRRRAVLGLRQIGGSEAIRALVGALKDDNKLVRAQAARTLGGIRSNQAAVQLAEALNDAEPDVRANASQALKRISSQEILRIEGGKRIVRALLEAINDENTIVRVRVVDTLRQIGGEIALTTLMRALKDKDSFVRAKAANALGATESNLATEKLKEALEDMDSRVRANAAEALGKIGDKQAVPNLVKALKDEAGKVRANAARSLGRIGIKRATLSLTETLDDNVADVRIGATWALGRIGDPRAVDGLVKLLRDINISVSKNAVDALGRIGNICRQGDAVASERVVATLVNVLKSDVSELHETAAEAITNIGGEQAVRKLVDALREKALTESRFYIAHEFRNVFAPLYAYVKMLDECLSPTDTDREKLLSLTARIRNQTNTAFELLNRYMDYSRLLKPGFALTDINDLMQQSLDEFKLELESREIVLETQFDEGADAEVDKEMLAQVFRNVIANAVQAIDKQGRLTVRTKLDALYTKLDKGQVEISFRDSGAGIKPEHLPYLFEIGFTTKSGVRGAGVGLALCRRIVEEAHNGSITIAANTRGPGATVVTTLPRRQKEAKSGRHEVALADRRR